MQSERKLHFRSILIPGPNKRWSVIVCISCTVDAPVTCQQLLFLAIIIVSCLPWSSGSCSDSEPIHFLCKQPNEVWKLFNLLLFAHNISFKHISDQVPTYSWSLRIQRDGFSPALYWSWTQLNSVTCCRTDMISTQFTLTSWSFGGFRNNWLMDFTDYCSSRKSENYSKHVWDVLTMSIPNTINLQCSYVLNANLSDKNLNDSHFLNLWRVVIPLVVINDIIKDLQWHSNDLLALHSKPAFSFQTPRGYNYWCSSLNGM